MDFKKYVKETLKSYSDELKMVQEAIQKRVGELDSLKVTEQRLLGAIASLNEMQSKEAEEKESKKAKA
jgi:hypothetical protein